MISLAKMNISCESNKRSIFGYSQTSELDGICNNSFFYPFDMFLTFLVNSENCSTDKATQNVAVKKDMTKCTDREEFTRQLPENHTSFSEFFSSVVKKWTNTVFVENDDAQNDWKWKRKLLGTTQTY